MKLPPALTLFALIAMGLLFGPLGVLFSAPLTVAAYVAVGELYVSRTLGENVETLEEFARSNHASRKTRKDGGGGSSA